MTQAEVQELLASFSDAERAAGQRRFFKTGPGGYGEGDLFRGIRMPQLRQVAAHYQALPRGEVAGLLTSPYHEDRMVALLMLVRQFRRADEAERSEIYALYLAHTAHINSWDLVDASAEHIVGAYLEARDRAPLYALAASTSVWERRIAILATFHYIKRGGFDETLRVADLLLDDPHDLIHKAVGWMLREVGKRDRAVEEMYLLPRYRRMPRTMLRYAIEHFEEERRRQFLQGRA